MSTTPDLAPTRTRPQAARRPANRAASKTKEVPLEDQIAALQNDLKSIAATLAKLGNDKVSEARDVAKTEAHNLQRQGQNVLDEVQDQAGAFEQQLKDTIREKPLTAVASAIGIGFVLALLSRR